MSVRQRASALGATDCDSNRQLFTNCRYVNPDIGNVDTAPVRQFVRRPPISGPANSPGQCGCFTHRSSEMLRCAARAAAACFTPDAETGEADKDAQPADFCA
jgi:hypothetical protein